MALALAPPPSRGEAIAAPVPEAGAPPVVARALVKRFAGRPVVDGLDLRVRAGEAVAIVGANGAGKSTLLRCLVRLIPVDAGEVELLGQPVTRLGPRRLRRLRAEIGFVFQRHQLVPRAVVLDNVLHGALGRSGPLAWHHRTAPETLRRRAVAALARVGLADLAPQRADRLSGGQSQRVAIARALMQAPRLMLADEPAASLDPRAGFEIMTLFRRLQQEDGTTLLLTSHNLEHALAFADRVIGLKHGRVALDASARSLTRADLQPLYG